MFNIAGKIRIKLKSTYQWCWTKGVYWTGWQQLLLLAELQQLSPLSRSYSSSGWIVKAQEKGEVCESTPREVWQLTTVVDHHYLLLWSNTRKGVSVSLSINRTSMCLKYWTVQNHFQNVVKKQFFPLLVNSIPFHFFLEIAPKRTTQLIISPHFKKQHLWGYISVHGMWHFHIEEVSSNAAIQT